MNRNRGSTLIELLAVLVISAIFLALLAPAIYNIGASTCSTPAQKEATPSAAEASLDRSNESISASECQGTCHSTAQGADASTQHVAAPNHDSNPPRP